MREEDTGKGSKGDNQSVAVGRAPGAKPGPLSTRHLPRRSLYALRRVPVYVMQMHTASYPGVQTCSATHRANNPPNEKRLEGTEAGTIDSEIVPACCKRKSWKIGDS